MRTHISWADYEAILRKQGKLPPITEKKQGKIPHNVTRLDGFVFQSDAELRRYGELKLLLMGGRIRDLRVHTTRGLVVNGEKVGTYTDDFSYFEKDEFVVEDVKSSWSRRDKHWQRAKKLMKACYGIDIREIVYN